MSPSSKTESLGSRIKADIPLMIGVLGFGWGVATTVYAWGGAVAVKQAQVDAIEIRVTQVEKNQAMGLSQLNEMNARMIVMDKSLTRLETNLGWLTNWAGKDAVHHP